MKPCIIAYVPVIHQGYLKFFRQHPEAETIYLFSQELIDQSDYLHKEIRSLTPEQTRTALTALNLPQQVALLDSKVLNQIADKQQPIIIPQEDVVRELVAQHLPDNPTTTDAIFLRWDRKNTTKQFTVDPDVSISTSQLDQKFIKKANQQADNSSDWWRQVGAVLVKDGRVVLASYNKHLPSEHQPYIDGDPRNCFSSGIHLELSTAIHAEAGLIAEAAKQGISLQDARLYVTTFPCPPCAKLIAQSGIEEIYFAEGYGVLDGKTVLKDAGVTIVQVTSQA